MLNLTIDGTILKAETAFNMRDPGGRNDLDDGADNMKRDCPILVLTIDLMQFFLRIDTYI